MYVVLYVDLVAMRMRLMGGGDGEEAYDISFTASDVCVCFGTCSAAAIIDCW